MDITRMVSLFVILSCGGIFAGMAVNVGISVPLKTVYQKTYPYSHQQEDLLLQLQQLDVEIKNLKQDRDDLESDIDRFYLNTKYNETSKSFSKEYNKIRFMENKIAAINRQIDDDNLARINLQKQWNAIRPDNHPLNEHVVYIVNHYNRSPFNLVLSDGFLVHKGSPYHYRYQEPKSHRSPPERVAPSKSDRLHNLRDRQLRP